MIHQKQQRRKQRDEASIRQVGIFWILPDGLRAYGFQYHEGEQYRDFIKTPDGHYETWEQDAGLALARAKATMDFERLCLAGVRVTASGDASVVTAATMPAPAWRR